MKLSQSLIKPIYIIIGISTIILFIASSIKHILFQSTAWDLAIFDQAVYLISQSKSPISSFLNIHILGDHAALIFYPLSLFYKIYPTVYWLLFIQAFCLSLGVLPIWYIAQYQGLKKSQSLTISLVYLLYPIIFNINLFDFHPDVIAIPAILWAILAAYTNNLNIFILAIIIILSCKGVLSLTVSFMGIWLLFFEKKRLFGSIALGLGVTWFIISTRLIIPLFSDNSANIGRHIARFSYLGNSFTEIAQNFIFKPWLLLQGLFNLPNLEYLLLLLVPLIWGLSFRHLSPLVAAIPVLGMNLLSQDTLQKDLLHQYSLPIIPFLMVSVIITMAAEKTWFRQEKYIIIWSLIGFLALAKFGYFTFRYLESLDTWKATQEAISQISSQDNVLTSTYIAPHLSQRSVIKLAENGAEKFDLQEFNYILLNKRHPGRASSPELIETLKQKIGQISKFQLIYKRDDVYLFKQ
ncbi:DUF2079 domain-containing protein [Aphanothece sacrum]|uniref:DUF2079 domain-containing protein n=1 Tax=Aphanothece sacrum FPU1 TaxID=1920663 RepID=A0A401IBN5_APHSA|nr:DUF2079 domain-containing protein [Aphanothece sacrum]GBF78634.1 hypothetical protein AsFPU1_0023 [Aphanothece sacrum FPU1]GBF84856.1 membrane protein [Aphanothece sacrum FPU3]